MHRAWPNLDLNVTKSGITLLCQHAKVIYRYNSTNVVQVSTLQFNFTSKIEIKFTS